MKNLLLLLFLTSVLLLNCRPARYETFRNPNPPLLMVNGTDYSSLLGWEEKYGGVEERRVRKKKGDFWHGQAPNSNFHVTMQCDGAGKLSGTVIDGPEDEPVPNVSIILMKGEEMIGNTYCDLNGNFRINAGEATHIQLEYVGFEPFHIPLQQVGCL